MVNADTGVKDPLSTKEDDKAEKGKNTRSASGNKKFCGEYES